MDEQGRLSRRDFLRKGAVASAVGAACLSGVTEASATTPGAYAYLASVGFVLVVTGGIKVVKSLPGVYLSPPLITATTLVHTFATVFFLVGVLAHLAALVLKVNRPLAKSIFTREVDLDYVRDRHTIWYDELKKKGENRDKTVKDQEMGRRDPEDGTKETLSQLDLQAGPEEKEVNDMVSTVKVKGMSCQHCVMSVKKALAQLDGIQDVEVDLQKGEVRFENKKGLESDQIVKAIEGAGYQVVQA